MNCRLSDFRFKMTLIYRIQALALILWFTANFTLTTPSVRNDSIVRLNLVIISKSNFLSRKMKYLLNDFCVYRPGSFIQSVYCKIDYISRKNLKIDIHYNFTKPRSDIWFHGSLNYKFNGLTYQKFPINLWENICDWMSGKQKAYILDWTLGRLTKYSNLNHSCPFNGYYFIRVNNMSMDSFIVEPLLPSGRYRLDLVATEGDRVPLTDMKLYFSISDHRLEVW